MSITVRKLKTGLGKHEDWIPCSWSPVTGCDRYSMACVHCYALERFIPWQQRLERGRKKKRLKEGKPAPYMKYRNGEKVTMHSRELNDPKHKRNGLEIFVCSMSDLFHDKVTDKFIHDIFNVMNECPQHNFRLITKRTKRLAAMAPKLKWTRNIWCGVTIEHPKFIDRADDLRKVPADVRFIYAEPLLGPLGKLNLKGIDTIIMGGESGPEARVMEKDWVLEILKMCKKSGTVPFFKQWGDNPLSGPDDRINGKRERGGSLITGKDYKHRLVFKPDMIAAA